MLVIGGACLVTFYKNIDLIDNDSALRQDIFFMTIATFALVFFWIFFLWHFFNHRYNFYNYPYINNTFYEPKNL